MSPHRSPASDRSRIDAQIQASQRLGVWGASTDADGSDWSPATDLAGDIHVAVSPRLLLSGRFSGGVGPLRRVSGSFTAKPSNAGWMASVGVLGRSQLTQKLSLDFGGHLGVITGYGRTHSEKTFEPGGDIISIGGDGVPVGTRQELEGSDWATQASLQTNLHYRLTDELRLSAVLFVENRPGSVPTFSGSADFNLHALDGFGVGSSVHLGWSLGPVAVVPYLGGYAATGGSGFTLNTGLALRVSFGERPGAGPH